ncbi:MAG: HepT-like ribonuclease domain-containing protein [Arcobacter sp.]|uniref:HepT-like ribonuclease domain-containing protein n=1 Tax=Arcobacter sp. TaxID=1872629 RepID=UPI003C70EF9E
MKNRLESILLKIEDIEFFIEQKNGKIMLALEDRILKPAIRMQIISIAEQFNKLKDENEFELLSKIDKNDLKGINAVRNFIAHDYDSVDDEILEIVLRVHIPKLKSQIINLNR